VRERDKDRDRQTEREGDRDKTVGVMIMAGFGAPAVLAHTPHGAGPSALLAVPGLGHSSSSSSSSGGGGGGGGGGARQRVENGTARGRAGAGHSPKVTVRVMSARRVRAADQNGRSDPYCIIKARTLMRHKRRLKLRRGEEAGAYTHRESVCVRVCVCVW
jgi:hypothetical protein